MSTIVELVRADFQENIGRAKRYWSASRLPTGERQKTPLSHVAIRVTAFFAGWLKSILIFSVTELSGTWI
ncbi:hypothetical protein SNA30_09575 [Escherichia coli]|nr:hypothetical protein [Escherichia coli]